MQPFRFLDHSADLGFEAFGKDLDELFENAAKALFSAMLYNVPKVSRKEEKFSLKSDSIEELLHNWLDELLFAFVTDGKAFSDFDVKISQGDGYRLDARAKYLDFNPREHKIKKEIKAITYHNLAVKKNSDWHCTVVCDT